MAGVEVTISGVLYDRLARTTQNVVLIGEATMTGLGVGGGPIIPPGGERPPGIWGPTDPRPTPPIYLPEPPRPPIDPPEGGGDKPPPEGGGWGYVSQWSAWGYFPGGDTAGPKR